MHFIKHVPLKIQQNKLQITNGTLLLIDEF